MSLPEIIFLEPNRVWRTYRGGRILDIMEPTDFVVRIEFERGGCVLPEEARFMNRDIDFALSMFNCNPTP
jgi:hypothetical protein